MLQTSTASSIHMSPGVQAEGEQGVEAAPADEEHHPGERDEAADDFRP